MLRKTGMTVELLVDPPTRRHPRVTVRGRVHLRIAENGQQAVDGELVSLSKGGAFISGIPSIPIGTEVEAYVLVPGGGAPIPVRARAIYNLRGDRRRANGTGFRFVAASHFADVRLQRAMERFVHAHAELLFRLSESEPDTAIIRALCGELGLKLPAEHRADRLRWRALHALNAA